MDQQVTREILWNIPAIFVVFLYGMLIPLAAAFVYVGLRWYRIVRPGVADRRPRFDEPASWVSSLARRSSSSTTSR